MKKILFIIFAGLVLTITSCRQPDPNKNIEEGKIEGNIYTSEEIGWSIEIPKGWTIKDLVETKKQNETGNQLLTETIGEELDFSEFKNMITFRKDQSNNFIVTSEPFNPDYDGDWEEHNSLVKEVIYMTYLNQKIPADTSATTIEKLDGVDFRKYGFTIYNPEGEVILEQIIFSALINDFDFSININYNNDKDRDELLEAFRKSKFKK